MKITSYPKRSDRNRKFAYILEASIARNVATPYRINIADGCKIFDVNGDEYVILLRVYLTWLNILQYVSEMSEIVRYYNEYSDIEISQKANIHSLLTKKILPLFRKLKDCMKLNKLFVLNVKICTCQT